MDDLHQRFEAWLLDGAGGDPPRDLAVHAALCPECAPKIAAFDALAAIDVAAAGPPPPLLPATVWESALVYLRMGGAAAGAILAGVLVVFVGSQFLDLGSAAPTMTPTTSASATDTQTPEPTPTPTASGALTASPSATAVPTFGIRNASPTDPNPNSDPDPGCNAASDRICCIDTHPAARGTWGPDRSGRSFG